MDRSEVNVFVKSTRLEWNRIDYPFRKEKQVVGK